MSKDWQELTALTKRRSFQVKRVQLTGTDIAIEGNFDLPPTSEAFT